MMERMCANCQHYGEEYPAYGMDYCNQEYSHYFTELVNRDNNGWLSLDGSFYADGVITHFMPLPKPPKEDKSE